MLGVLGDWIATLSGYTAARLGNLRLRPVLSWSDCTAGARMEVRAGRVYCWLGWPFMHILASWDSKHEPEPEMVHVYNQYGKRKAILRMNDTLYSGLMRGVLMMPDGCVSLSVQTHQYNGPLSGWYVRVYERGAEPPDSQPPGWTSWEQFYEQFHQ